jgi:hypothetical protein
MNRTTGDSPYIFPDLTATRGGIPDPLVEVDCWLSRLQDVLDAGPETADEASDLLALWAKLRRARPELIEQLEGMQVLAQADATLAARGSDLASQALTVPNPRMWLLAVQALDQAFEDVGLAEARSTLAEGLLTDLDDATLALYAARRHGIDDRELESELEPCLDWLAENAGLFLPAAVHVQAMGMSLRPDLAEFDYGLAVTALKYVDILYATKAAEEELSLSHVQQLDASQARRLAARFREERQRTTAARAAFLTVIAVKLRDRMRQVPLARAGESVPLEPLYWCEWASPAGNLTARLTIPPQPAADERVMLEFLDAAQRRATDLAGQTATLHAAEATIDSTGKATFLLSPLLETDQPLILRVGPEQSEWPLVEAETVQEDDTGP